MNIDPEHVIADPFRNLLYATVHGGSPNYPNELVIIDPCSAVIIDSVFVGSNPSTMAISDDSSTLWVSLKGSYEVARVNLQTTPPSVEATYLLPPYNQNLTYAGSMVVLPGTVDSLAVSLHRLNVSPSFAGVTILDDGVPRPNKTPGHTGASRLTGGPEGWLFGFNNLHTGFEFWAIEVLADGPQQTEHEDLVTGFQTDIVYADGRVYATTGQIVDVGNPAQPVPEGTFAWSGAVLPRPEQQRVLMLTPPPFGQSLATLRELNPVMFTQIASVGVEFGVDVDAVFDFTSADGVVLAIIASESDIDNSERLVLIVDPF